MAVARMRAALAARGDIGRGDIGRGELGRGQDISRAAMSAASAFLSLLPRPGARAGP